jgi:putative membrane protein
MVSYNPKDWFTFIFRFHKADTFRQLLPMILGISIYSAIIAFLELQYWQLSDSNYVRNVPIMHSLLGFAISMLLVFRTNTAYDRWWEGRRLWGGLVNSSRNFAMKLESMLPPGDESNRNFFRKIIPGFAQALHHHLHEEKTRTELFASPDHGPDFAALDHDKHVPNQLATLMHMRLQQLYREKVFTGEQLLFLNNELQSFTDICGACERIKNTPIPFSYSVFIKKFIFFYIMTLPFGYVFQLGYYVVPVVAFVFYVLASLELIAEEIEDPFGGDPNDIPTEIIAQNIDRNVSDIL